MRKFNKKKIKVCYFTFSRSEFGLMKKLINKLRNNNSFTINVVVGGSHLSRRYGLSVNEIINSNIKIDDVINYDLNINSEKKIINFMNFLQKKSFDLLKRLSPDVILIMGDRYELLPICNIATVCNIPIAHVSGGEVTTGAIDDQIRHAISKFSHIHFVANQEFKNRLMRMGEENWRITVSGEPGLERIKDVIWRPIDELSKEYLDLKQITALVTFHSVTKKIYNLQKQIEALFSALKKFQMNIIFTGSNSDLGGSLINDKIRDYVKKNDKCIFVKNLGFENYHNLLKHVNLMIGNSSSGIVEAASYNLPVVNIGDRQEGRPQTCNVINSSYSKTDIINKIALAIKLKVKVKNLYFKNNSSEIIIKKLKKIFTKFKKEKILKKFFFDK